MTARTNHGLWLVLAGFAIAASCALPEYKTDSSLSESSSSASGTSGSSSGSTSSGGGQGGGGTAGSGGTAGVGGEGGGEPGVVKVNCPVDPALMQAGTLCNNFIDEVNGTGECRVVGPDPMTSDCCIVNVQCMMIQPNPPKYKWEIASKVCEPMVPGCPYECGGILSCAAFDPMKGLPPQGCKCVNLHPQFNGPLDDCLYGVDKCFANAELNKFTRLSCEGTADGFGPITVTHQGCCTPNGACGGGASGSCTPNPENVSKPGECKL